MNDQPVQPVQLNQRTQIVDILRGWALFGVVLMNYSGFFMIDRDHGTFKPDTVTNVILYCTSTLFSSKSWTMLSLLFGYGFAVLMNNVSNKGQNAYLFFIRRMFWLLVLAFINSAIFFGDILKDYAVLGLLLLLFSRSSARTAFIVSIVLLLLIPALSSYISSLNSGGRPQWTTMFHLYKSNHVADVLYFGLKATWLIQVIGKSYLYTVHAVMFCCFLWGFALYKIDFFSQLAAKKKYIKRAFWISLGVTLLLTAFFMITKELKWTIKKYYNMQYWVVLSTMLFFCSAICWLYIAAKCKRFFSSLAVMGKMTLTNYIMQNFIGLFIFSGLGLGIWNTQPIWFYLLLATGIYTAQVYFSSWWLSRYAYGPIEWIWRQLSYRKRLPLRKKVQG